MVLGSTYAQEELKRRIASANPKFYLIQSKDPFATYKILWYRVGHRRSCKVDILQPGIMNIPLISTDKIEYINNLPVMPFSLNLLMKLQGWEDHKNSPKFHHNQKQFMDINDLNRMLPIAVARGAKPRMETWIPEDFIRIAEIRVKEYVRLYDNSRKHWEHLGFETQVSELENL